MNMWKVVTHSGHLIKEFSDADDAMRLREEIENGVVIQNSSWTSDKQDVLDYIGNKDIELEYMSALDLLSATIVEARSLSSIGRSETGTGLTAAVLAISRWRRECTTRAEV